MVAVLSIMAIKAWRPTGHHLFFFDPKTPYAVEPLEQSTMGGHLIFKEYYLDTYFRNPISKSPIFSHVDKPIFSLEPEEIEKITILIDKIKIEHNSDYEFKDDLIRNSISELLHFAVKKSPLIKKHILVDENIQLAFVFIEQLDRQFQTESLREPFVLRSPGKFAETLGVHNNSMNRAVRGYTGKTTSDFISDRINE